MSQLKKFNENGQEVGFEEAIINEQNFNAYAEQYGLERALGYQDCLTDMLIALQTISLRPVDGGFFPNNPSFVSKALINFLNAQNELSKKIASHISDSVRSKSNDANLEL